MKKLFLFLTLLIFSFHYCNDNILIYKNDLKEIKINTVVIQKKYNDKVYDLKVSVGEDFLGKVTSFSIEILGNDSSFENVIINSREKIKYKHHPTYSNYILQVKELTFFMFYHLINKIYTSN